jgi:flagellar basal-body rod modification protein FlgD
MEAQSISSILGGQTTAETQTDKGILGKEDFLKMLTAQMRYQNPLEPMNDQEFVAQMAQFSSLEQLQNMNSTLSQSSQWDMLLSQTINNTMATSLIGKTVTAESNSVSLEAGGSAAIGFTSSDFALSGTVTIYGADDSIVRIIPLSEVAAGQSTIHWNGKDGEGNEVAAGDYTYQVDLKDVKGASVSVTGYRSGVVEAIKYANGQAMLLVDGSYISLSEVREVKPEKP